MSQELLLISKNPDDPAFLAEVAGVLGATVVTEPDPIRAVEHLAETAFSGIFIDVTRLDALKAFEMEVQKRFGLLGDQVQAARVHFISDGPISRGATPSRVLSSRHFTSVRRTTSRRRVGSTAGS